MSSLRTTLPGATLNRREALKRLGAAAAGAAVAGAPAVAQVQPRPNIDADILNFALNLEYLEAEYYVRAVFGAGLPATVVGGSPGPVTGGRKVEFQDAFVSQLAGEIAQDERNHVVFLRTALALLGGPVDRPAIDFTNAFNAAATAAGLPTPFDPFANDLNFLLGAFLFEDVGVSAYQGAAPLITNENVILSAAAGILGTEAYHAGAVRRELYQLGAAAQAAASRISNARDTLDGPADLDQPLVRAGRANIVPSDANAVAFPRTTSQVLRIVYLGGTARGGFFPNGLNGNIKTAS